MNRNSDLASKIYAIFIAVIKCFILACGISLLLFFFYDNELEFTKDNIKCVVGSIHALLLAVVGVLNLLSAKMWSVEHSSTTASDVIKPFGKAIISNKEKTHEYTRRVVTVHEAGHAVMAYLRNANTIVVTASLCKPNVATGYDTFGNVEDVKSMILVKYAGAIAEELIFGYYHMGSFLGDNSDFKSATELIKGYITMINSEMSKTLLDKELESQLIDISKAFYQESKELLSSNIKLVEHLSSVLTDREELTTEEVFAIINDFKDKEENTNPTNS